MAERAVRGGIGAGSDALCDPGGQVQGFGLAVFPTRGELVQLIP